MNPAPRNACPVLGALPPDEGVLVHYVGSAYRPVGQRPVAHRVAVGSMVSSVENAVSAACGAPDFDLLRVEAQDAAYFAVPCTDPSCFPTGASASDRTER